MASGWLAAKAGEARRPPVEPWSLAAYGVALGVWLLVALGFAITRFDSDGSLTRFHVQVAALVLPAMGLRYLSFPRLATAIEAMAVKMTISAGFAFASVILAATNRPLVDAMLHRWDLAIGFDWRTAMAMLQPHGGAIAALHWIYATLPYQMFLLVPLAAFFGQERRIWVFVAAWGLCLFATMALFPFFPAVGPIVHFDHYLAGIPPKNEHMDVFTGARDGSLSLLGAGTVRGMVTFPSFHAAGAVLLGWLALRLPWARLVAVPLNAAMVVSAIPIGGHYLVDILAGVALAVAAIVLAARLTDAGARLVRRRS